MNEQTRVGVRGCIIEYVRGRIKVMCPSLDGVLKKSVRECCSRREFGRLFKTLFEMTVQSIHPSPGQSRLVTST